MNNFVKILQSKSELNSQESYDMQHAILAGKVKTEELIEIFKLMDGRYPTLAEINGIIAATRESMVQLEINSNALDMVGTGGDGKGTFNISTAAAIVCASCGVPVAKHGNRSATSRCGSADVLEKLGVNIMLDSEGSVSCFEKTGIVFLFAPLFHPALKNAAQTRKQFGKRTYFNILGPLVNPAKVTHLTLGIFDPEITQLMGKTSIANGAKHVWIVHSPDGMDELSPYCKANIRYFSESESEGRLVEPDYTIRKGDLGEIQAAGAEDSARIIMAVFRNEAISIQMETVILNAAAGMMTFGKAANFKDAMMMAREAIESGRALTKFNQLREVSNE